MRRSRPLPISRSKAPDDWARPLPDLLPAMNLCLASDGGRAKWIARATPNGGGAVRVRIIETSGKAVDCEADASGKGLARIEPAAATDPPRAGPAIRCSIRRASRRRW